GLRGDLDLEGARVHRLEVRDDRGPGERFLELADDLHPFGLDQGRAGLEPVRASFHGLRGGEEGPLAVHVVQGHLEDRLRGPRLPRALDKSVTTGPLTTRAVGWATGEVHIRQ